MFRPALGPAARCQCVPMFLPDLGIYLMLAKPLVSNPVNLIPCCEAFSYSQTTSNGVYLTSGIFQNPKVDMKCCKSLQTSSCLDTATRENNVWITTHLNFLCINIAPVRSRVEKVKCAKWYHFKENTVLHYKYVWYSHKTNPSVFTILYATNCTYPIWLCYLIDWHPHQQWVSAA